MCKDKKTLADKVGSPDDILGKKAAKKGMKQTKLVFPKKEEKSPFSSKNSFNGSTANSDLSDGSDEEFNTSVTPSFGRERTARQTATKPKKYRLSDEDSDRSRSSSSDAGARKAKIAPSSESEDEKQKPLRKMESSEDMFDQLIGRKKESPENGSVENGSPEVKPISNRHQMSGDLFNSDSDAMEDESKENNKRKKKSESDDDFPKNPKKKLDNGTTKSKPAKKTKKKNVSDSDSESDFAKAKPAKKTKKKKNDSDSDAVKAKPVKKTKKKKNGSDADDIFDVSIPGNDDEAERAAVKRAGRPGRNAAKSKYVFDDDSDFSD